MRFPSWLMLNRTALGTGCASVEAAGGATGMFLTTRLPLVTTTLRMVVGAGVADTTATGAFAGRSLAGDGFVSETCGGADAAH